MIPERYKNAEYSGVPKDIQAALKKISETKRGLYIYGSVGSGKTYIAYAVVNRAKERGKDIPVWNMTELLREMRQDFNRPYGEKREIEREIMEYDGIIILDDVGAEKTSEWVEETFYLIVNYRYNNMLPTIFTSNLPLSQLSEKIGDRSTSRIAEMCDVFELTGEDKRIINKEKTRV